MWKWANYVHAEAARVGRKALLVNLDETSIPVMAAPRGVVVRYDAEGERLSEVRQQCSRADQRANFTHVAMICNDEALQKVLTQVLIVPRKVLTMTMAMSLREHLPRNVYVLREEKG